MSNGAANICFMTVSARVSGCSLGGQTHMESYLGHHPAPGHDISFAPLLCLLLKGNYRIQQCIEVLISCIVELFKYIKPDIQVCWQTGRIIVLQRRIPQREVAIAIIRERRNLLYALMLVCSAWRKAERSYTYSWSPDGSIRTAEAVHRLYVEGSSIHDCKRFYARCRVCRS